MMSPRGMRFNRMETMATKVYHRKVPEEGLYGARTGIYNTIICMHVCMHLCMHVCMHVCMYVCMYVCIYVCMYMYEYV